MQPECDPVHEVSIIPRGMMAGYTMTLPEDDSRHVFKSKLIADLSMMLGGRAAEKLVLGDVSTGAVSDLQRASDIARDMVVKYGMSDVVGPVYLSSNQELLLGKEIGHTKTYSEELAAKIDEEVKRILDAAMEKSERLLRENEARLHKIAAVLIERERIDGDEFNTLWDGGELPPMEGAPKAENDSTQIHPQAEGGSPQNTGGF
jgi:cell division protease FtsH